MFAVVKFLKGTSVRQFRRSVGVRNEEGKVVTRYFENLYNPPTNADRQLLREYEFAHERDGQLDQLTISETEVKRAVKAVQNRKPAGNCGLPPELLKYGEADMI